MVRVNKNLLVGLLPCAPVSEIGAWRGRGDMAQFIGRVIGTKMQKTAKVEVTRMFLHPQVLKVYLLHLAELAHT